MHLFTLTATILLFSAAAASPASAVGLDVDVNIPANIEAIPRDAVLCTAAELPHKAHKIVRVAATAEEHVVQRVLLHGCETPHKKPETDSASAWDCTAAPKCGSGHGTIIFEWGKDAEDLAMPKGAGLSVGKGSSIAWLVMEVQYQQPRPDDDKTALSVSLQDLPVPYNTGMMSYSSWISIPPGEDGFLLRNKCCYRGFQPLTTFAARVHTHFRKMGQNVYMTRSVSGKREMVAAGNPRKIQGFRSITSEVIWPGERLTVTCAFDSSGKSTVVNAGPEYQHDMCSMQLMVYSSLPHMDLCTNGASAITDAAPGNMPRAATILPDPFPLWKPPNPADMFEGDALGLVTSVTVAPDGTLWALHLGNKVWHPNTFDHDNKMLRKTPITAKVVVQMHPDTGKVLRQWGSEDFWLPHSITVDRNNSIWVADAGRHQVFKFTASGKLLLTVGKKDKPGDKKTQFCKPTQVAVMNDGSFLVADGYCNSRVMRFNANGSYHSSYELPKNLSKRPSVRQSTSHSNSSSSSSSSSSSELDGSGSGSSQMRVAHSLVIDECDDELLVADRDNGRVLRFNLHDNKLLDGVDLSQYGKVEALRKGPYGRTLALTWNPGFSAHLVDVAQPDIHWIFPNSTQLWPHDFALGPAALHLTRASDRLLSIYVTPLCDTCGHMRKYILFPHDFMTDKSNLSQPILASAANQVLLDHLHGSSELQAAAAAAGFIAVNGSHLLNSTGGTMQDNVELLSSLWEQEQESESKVQQAGEQEYMSESQKMQSPELVAELQSKLQALEKQLELYKEVDANDTEIFETIYTSGQILVSRHGIAGLLSGLAAVVLLGMMVGAVAVQLLSSKPVALQQDKAQQKLVVKVAFEDLCELNEGDQLLHAHRPQPVRPEIGPA